MARCRAIASCFRRRCAFAALLEAEIRATSGGYTPPLVAGPRRPSQESAAVGRQGQDCLGFGVRVG
jgi:hypothetical protein